MILKSIHIKLSYCNLSCFSYIHCKCGIFLLNIIYDEWKERSIYEYGYVFHIRWPWYSFIYFRFTYICLPCYGSPAFLLWNNSAWIPSSLLSIHPWTHWFNKISIYSFSLIRFKRFCVELIVYISLNLEIIELAIYGSKNLPIIFIFRTIVIIKKSMNFSIENKFHDLFPTVLTIWGIF